MTKFEKKLKFDLDRILDLNHEDMPISYSKLFDYLVKWKSELDEIEGEYHEEV